jgi:hypothetical protein
MREACPASYRMEDGVEESDSEFAEEGRMLHEAMAKIIAPEPTPELGVTDEQDECLAFCVSSIPDYTGKPIFIEKLLYLDGNTKPGITHGTADLVIDMGDGRGVVIDWKFGRGAVSEAFENLQLAAYAVMAADRYGFDEVEAMIVQPRLRKVSRHTYRDFENIRAHIEGVIRRASEPDAPIVPGEAQCKYCRGFDRCPKVRSDAVAVSAKVEKLVPISTMSTPEISMLVDATSAAVKFHALAKAALRDRMVGGEVVNGWEIKPGAKRKEADASELFGADVQRNLSALEYTACCKVSIPKVKAAWVKAESEKTGITKKDAGNLFDEATAYAVKTTQGEPRLVRSGDSEEPEAV